MTSGIDVFFTVNDRALRAHLDKLPQELQDKLVPEIQRLTASLLARVQAAEPGPKTGELSKATRSFVDQKEGWIRGRVRVLPEPDGNPKHNIKAGALEYGVQKLIEVHAHDRGGATIDAYEKDMRLAAYRFLRDAAADLRPQFEAMIERAIAEVARDFR